MNTWWLWRYWQCSEVQAQFQLQVLNLCSRKATRLEEETIAWWRYAHGGYASSKCYQQWWGASHQEHCTPDSGRGHCIKNTLHPPGRKTGLQRPPMYTKCKQYIKPSLWAAVSLLQKCPKQLNMACCPASAPWIYSREAATTICKHCHNCTRFTRRLELLLVAWVEDTVFSAGLNADTLQAAEGGGCTPTEL